MKNPFKKISKKTVLIASTLVVLIAIPVLVYFLTREQGDVKSWYSSSWMYRRAITVNNPGGTLTNEDVLITLDTASLISAGKLQADCDDLRFVDSDDATLLSYWIEGGCNTTNTQVWVRIPSLPSGGKIIYVYYNNPPVTTTEQSWGGNFITINANGTCPSGSSRNTSFDSRYAMGSSTLGSVGGSASAHAHSNISASFSGCTTSYHRDIENWYWAASNHSHTATISIGNSTETIPPYLSTPYCQRNKAALTTSTIFIFQTLPSSGWTRFSSLDNRFPLSSATYGTTGGSSTHYHTSTSVNTSTAGETSMLNAPGSNNAFTQRTHYHNVPATNSSSESNLPPYINVIYATPNSNNIPTPSGAINSVSSVPPLGWDRVTTFDNRFMQGASSYGSAGGSSTHTHSFTFTTGTSTNSTTANASSSATSRIACQPHTHTSTYSTNYVSVTPPYYTLIYAKKKVSQGASVGNEQIFNQAPTAPTALLTEGATNPAGVTDLTPEFSAIYNDPDTGDTATYYEIEVNTNNTFTGTVMWVSNKTAMSAVANGARIADKSYAGTTLSLNGITLYWRIRLWDNNDTVSPWSATAQFTMNSTPTAPTALLTEGATNPTGVTDLTPEFSAIYNDPDTGDTATYYEIEVNTTSAFNGTVMWDSNKTAMSAVNQGARIADKSYAGTTLSTNGTTYYWRIRLWDNSDTVSPWSATAQFTMNSTPTAPTALLTEGATNPTKVTDLTPEFSAIYNDPDTGDTAIYYEIEVNTTSAFNGTVMWNSNKTSMNAVANGARIADLSYAGTTLSLNGATYYWRIRLWDNSDTVSPWSATAQFTMSSPPNAPVELTVDGYLTPTYQIFSLYPSFRAKHTDINTDSAVFYEIEVNSNSVFTGTVMWDTGKQSMTSTPNNSVCPNITYAGNMLSNSLNTYYWRIRFWDTDDMVSPWSATASFVDRLTNIQLEGIGLEGLGIN